MKIDSEKTIAHLKERLVETALNNIGYNEDVYLNIADHRIETWINEISPVEPTVDEVIEWCRKRCLMIVTDDLYAEMTRRWGGKNEN